MTSYHNNNNNTLRCMLLILSIMIYLPTLFLPIFNTITILSFNQYFILPQQKQKQKQHPLSTPKLSSSQEGRGGEGEGGEGGGGAIIGAITTSNNNMKKKKKLLRQQQKQQTSSSSSNIHQQPLLLSVVDSSTTKYSPAAAAVAASASASASDSSPESVVHDDTASSSSFSSSSILPLPFLPPPFPLLLDNDNNNNNNNDDYYDNIDNNDFGLGLDDDEWWRLDDEWWEVTTLSSNALADDIDLESINTTTSCGSYKCFYQSKSHPNYGYLIGQDRRSPIKILKAYKMKDTNTEYNPYLAKPEISYEYALQTYKLTLKLEKMYGINHLCVSPPILISKMKHCSYNTNNVSSNSNNKLISILNQGFVSDFHKQNRTITKHKYFRCPTEAKTNNGINDNDAILSQLRDDTIFIQVVQKAPEPNFLITPTIGRRKINIVHGAKDFFNPQIKLNPLRFRQNLQNDWNRTKLAWLDTPELLQDFQFLLDYEGKIWQIDLDRIHNTRFDNNAKSVWIKSKNENWQNNDNATLFQLGQLEKQIIQPLIEKTYKYENQKNQNKKKKNKNRNQEQQDGEEEGNGNGTFSVIITSDDVTNNDNNDNDNPKKKEVVVDRGNKATTTTSTTNNSPRSNGDTDNVDEWWKHTTESSETLLEDINDMDVINQTTTCGYWKCYFASKTHLGYYGYVIGQDRRKSNEILKAIEEENNKPPEIALENTQKSYNLAQRLQEQYGIRHLMVSPPIPIENCSIDLANVLNVGFVSYSNSTTKNHKKAGIPEWYRYYRDANYPKVDPSEHNPIYDTRDNALVIQVMKQAPAPNLLIRTSRLAIFNRHGAKDFFDNPKVIVNDTFKENLLRDWNSTRLAWLDTPQLSLDYQFLLDYQGRIWQIDIDRIYGDADPNAIVWSTTNNTDRENHSLSEDNATSFKLDRIEDLIINRIMSYRVSRKQQQQQQLMTISN